MTDYGFAPGNTGFDRAARDFLELRPDTVVIAGRRLRTVQDFVEHLDNAPALQRPFGDLLIVSHANDEGWLQIALDGPAADDTTYDDLVRADDNRTIRVPKAFFEGDDGKVVRNIFRIVGCNIGRVPAFVERLRQAIGDTMRVRAPRHLNSIFVLGRSGSIEHLEHALAVSAPQRMADRRSLVTAFQNANLEFYDGTPVDPASFERWIPRRLPRRFFAGNNRIRITDPPEARPRLGQSIDGERLIRVGLELRHTVRGFQYTIGYEGGPPPRREADQIDALRASLDDHPEFDDNHPYPVFRRYGHDSRGEFIDGWSWTCRPRGQVLRCAGTRHDYRLSIPLVDARSGNLLFDFFPSPRSQTPVIRTLQTDDRRLFFTTA